MFFPHPPPVIAKPTDPAAFASATYTMGGLGVAGANAWAITPSVTGRVLFAISGYQLADATARTCTMQLSYGTGSAPAAGAAVTGTQVGGQPIWISLTGAIQAPFTMFWIQTGLTLGTAYWLDIAAKASAGTVTLKELNIIAFEM